MSRLQPENFSTPLNFLNHTKYLNPPPPRKFFNPPPENFLTPHRKFLNPPQKFFSILPKIFHPPPKKKNFSTPLKISQPHLRKSQPKNMLTINPPPPPHFIYFHFSPTSFPSLFKENLKIEGGGLNPLTPPPPQLILNKDVFKGGVEPPNPPPPLNTSLFNIFL